MILTRLTLAIGILCSVFVSPAQSGPPAKTDALGDPLPPGAIQRLGTTRLWHGPLPKDVLFLDNERLLSVASARSYGLPSRLWDAATGKAIGFFNYSDRDAARLIPSPDRKKAIVIRNSSTLKMIDLVTGKTLQSFQASAGSNVADACFSPDGRFFALGQLRSFEIWSTEKMQMLRKFERPALNLSWSPDGKTLAIAGTQTKGRSRVGMVSVVDAMTGKELRSTKPARDPAYNICLHSPDGRYIAATHRGSEKIHILDARDLSVQTTLTGKSRLAAFGLHWNPVKKNQLAVGGRFHNVHVWDARTGNVIWTQENLSAYTTRLSYSPDGTRLAGAGRGGLIYIWDSQTGKPVLEGRRHLSSIASLDLAADRGSAITAGTGGDVLLWNLSDASGPTTMHDVTYRPQAAVLAQGGRSPVVLCSQVGQIDLLSPGQKSMNLPVPAVAGGLSPDGSGMDILNNRGVYQRIGFGGKTLRETKLFSPGRIKFYAGWMSPDRTWWAVPLAASLDLFYLPAEPDQEHRASPPQRLDFGGKFATMGFGFGRYQGIAFSPDGSVLATIDQGHVKLVETDSGRSVLSLDTGRKSPTALCFTPEGRILAVGLEDGEIHFFSIASGKKVHELRGHAIKGYGQKVRRQSRANMVQDQPLAVTHLKFERQGKLLLSGSADHTVLIWDTANLSSPLPATDEPAQKLWQLLADTEASKAYRARWDLVSIGRQEAMELLESKLEPSSALTVEEVRVLVNKLASPRYAERNQAQQKLQQAAIESADAMKQILKENLPLETASRVRKILDSAGQVTTDSVSSLQAWRSVRVLEALGTARAVGLLRRLAQGSPSARQTQLAKDALRRLGQGK